MRSIMVFTVGLLSCTGGLSFGSELKIGDAAPKLEISHWIKGSPIDFEKNKGENVYLIEFWATWCGPCIQSMPHMTELQKKYKNKNLVVVGVTDEPKNVAGPFIKKMGNKAGYTFACDSPSMTPMGPMGKTYKSYMLAAGQNGIPTAFIITKDLKVAWIGSPFAGMDSVLEEVLNGTFDIELAKADDDFAREHMMELLEATQLGQWDKVVAIGRKVADPKTKLSKSLRAQLLNGISWELLTSHLADKKNFKEALYLAKAAYDTCEGKDASVVDTYAKALFETGRISEAVEYQARAVELSEGPMKVELLQTLEEYKKSLPTQGS